MKNPLFYRSDSTEERTRRRKVSQSRRSLELEANGGLGFHWQAVLAFVGPYQDSTCAASSGRGYQGVDPRDCI
jgi:hypothetical protein